MRVALAVSGGGDSIALMLLFASWAKRRHGILPAVLTVDHGLRDGSSQEAAQVATWARKQGLEVRVLRWEGPKPQSGIEEKARAERYRLLGEWCVAHAVNSVLAAHTRDDQAETFLLRLGRGSGVDGLSAMRARAPLPVPEFKHVQLLRPLLGIGRAELRDYLAKQGARWLEDPMNEDVRFARVRIRGAMSALEAAGVPVRRVAEAAGHLGRAREALDGATAAFLAEHARISEGELAVLDAAAVGRIPREIALRALSLMLIRVSRAAYRARFERLEALLDWMTGAEGGARTLLGCRIGRAPKAGAVFGPATLLITPERPRRDSGGRRGDRRTPDAHS